MATAKKCDICGKFYELYNTEDDENKVNGLMLLNIDESGKYFVHKAIDCCPTCMETIVEAIKRTNKQIRYLCNRGACSGRCMNTECNHTVDIRFAKNFIEDVDGGYTEKEN